MGAILKQQGAEQYVVTYKGTDFSTFEGRLKDFILADAQIAIGLYTSQLDSADKLYNIALNKAGGDISKVTVVGHSLGGALAEYVGFLYPVEVYTFNALGTKRLFENKSIKGHDSLGEYNNIKSCISVIDMVGNLVPHCNKQLYFVNKTLNYINNKLRLALMKSAFELAKSIVARMSEIREIFLISLQNISEADLKSSSNCE